MIHVGHGEVVTDYGPGVSIELDGNEVAAAIDHWLHARGIYIYGARTIRLTGPEEGGVTGGARVYVDPSGSVMDNGRRFNGRGTVDE